VLHGWLRKTEILQRQLDKLRAEIQQLMAEKQGAASGTATLVPFRLPNMMYVEICCAPSFENIALQLPKKPAAAGVLWTLNMGSKGVGR